MLLRSSHPLHFAGLLLLAGCVGAPPHCVESRDGTLRGTVCGPTVERARETTRMLEQADVALRDRLPDLVAAPWDVWLQERPQVFWLFPAGDEVDALLNPFTDRIHVTAGSTALPTALVHERIHQLLGPAWDDLPAILEEGLCDQIASRVAAGGLALRTDRLFRAATALDALELHAVLDLPGGPTVRMRLELDGESPPDAPLSRAFADDDGLIGPFHAHGARGPWYGLAFVAVGRLVDRVGAEGLRDLVATTAEQGEEEALAAWASAADLTTRDDWLRAVDEQLTADVRHALAEDLANGLALWTRRQLTLDAADGGTPEAADLARRIESAAPRLEFGPRLRATVDLRALPAFRTALDLPPVE